MAALIMLLIPVGASTAAAIATAIELSGATAAVMILLETIRTGWAGAKLLALHALMITVNQALSDSYSEVATGEPRHNLAAAQYEFQGAVEPKKESLFSVYPLPVLTSPDQASEYYSAASQQFIWGVLSSENLAAAHEHYITYLKTLGYSDPQISYPVGAVYESLPALLPAFESLEACEFWYQSYAARYVGNLITWDTYRAAYNHYSAEYDRLTTPADTRKADVVLEEGAVQATLEVTPESLAGLSDALAAATEAAAALQVAAISGVAAEYATAIANLSKALADVQAAAEAANAAAISSVGTNVADAVRPLPDQVKAGLDGVATATREGLTASGAATAAAIDATATKLASSEQVVGQVMAAAIPIAAATAVTEIAKMAKTWGHDVKVGERTCWASTAADLLGKLAGAAVPLLAIKGVQEFSPLREALDNLVKSVFDGVLNDPSLSHPVTPEDAPAVARTLFLKAAEFGMEAHLISVLAETVTPLKTLGVGQLAAALGDLAGFAKIGGAMMGAIETQGLARPFGYYVNKRLQSNRPNAGQLGGLAGDYELTKEEYQAEMEYQGYSRAWSDKLWDGVFKALAPRQLQQMAEAGIADDAYFDRELHHAGLREESIPLLKEMFRLAALGELKPAGQAVAVKRYKEGITTEAELSTELVSLGFRGIKLDKAIEVARLERDTESTLDQIALLKAQFLGDEITADQLLDGLKLILKSETAADTIHAATVLKYRPPKVPDRLPRLRESLATTWIDYVEMGYRLADQVRPEVLSLGYSQDEADLLLRRAELAADQAMIADQVKVMEEAYIDKELTLDQLRSRLLEIPLPPTRVTVLVELARLRAQPTPKAPAAEDLPELTTSQLLAAYRSGIITAIMLRQELTERHYSQSDISIMIAIEDAKAPAPTPAKVKLASESDLKAFFAAGIISAAELLAGLIRLGYDQLTARRLVELEIIKAEKRAK